MCICFSLLWNSPLTNTNGTNYLTFYRSFLFQSCYSALRKNIFSWSLTLVFIWSRFCVIEKLVRKGVGRRKRSTEYSPRHGWLRSQVEENWQERRSRQISPLSSERSFFPHVKKGAMFVTIFFGSQSLSAILIMVSLKAKSSEMCFWNEVIITYSTYL